MQDIVQGSVTKCGFISIVGRPNVGKSTLMNHLLGQKISITSRKPQTTQYKIKGVLTTAGAQFVFTDTPGFQKLYLNKMNELLNQSVVDSLSHVDVILYVVEAGIFNRGDEAVLELLPPNKPVVLVVNKQDKVKDKAQLNQFIDTVRDKFSFFSVITVSAKHHLGLEELLLQVKPLLPAGEFLYPEDQLTDRSSKFLAAEIIREKLFRNLGEELPYSIAVMIDEFSEKDPKLTRVTATILVEKANQKGIVIGKNGEKLKKILTESRLSMEELLENKVFLQVWVKEKSGFTQDSKYLQQFQS